MSDHINDNLLPWETPIQGDGVLKPEQLKNISERREKIFEAEAVRVNEVQSGVRRCSGKDCTEILTNVSGFCSDKCRESYWVGVPSTRGTRILTLNELKKKMSELASVIKERHLSGQNAGVQTATTT